MDWNTWYGLGKSEFRDLKLLSLGTLRRRAIGHGVSELAADEALDGAQTIDGAKAELVDLVMIVYEKKAKRAAPAASGVPLAVLLGASCN
eukprot:SAG31_NODE_12071_length_971_cov_1.025229_1_plen_89_part_10